MTIDLSETQVRELEARARKLGLSPKQLVEAAVTDLVSVGDDAFDDAANRVLSKNAELYRRLS